MTAAAPSTASRPHLLIFDGDCGFCTTWVGRLQRALPRFPESVPSQWTDTAALGLTEDDVANYVWFITPTHQYAGHLAVSALLRSQPTAPLRLAGHLLATPPFSWLAAVGYTLVSKNRHRLPGGTPACRMPRPEASAR